MKYAEFREKTKAYPFFRSNMFNHITDNVTLLRRQVSEWIKKGYVIQLKRGFYTLCEQDREVSLSSYYLANSLYSPSYISLETALSIYGFIPEQVNAITSVSSKKTQYFENTLGRFYYHHIKTNLYGGFIAKKDEYGNNFFIATPERAIVDFLYLKTRGMDNIDADVFDASFRFQNLETLNKSKLTTMAKQFGQIKLIKLINMLKQQMGD